MELVACYPIVITDRLRECRDFYRHRFGFETAFEADWIVVLSSGGERPATLAFMHSEHPSTPPSPPPYRGDGTFITFQVEDARSEYERLVAGGLRCELELTDEPWAQRRFAVIDPPGCGWRSWSRPSRPRAGGTPTWGQPRADGRVPRPARRALPLSVGRP